MGFILQIGLTIWACIRCHQAKKGWALGLIPLGAVVAGGILIGMIVGVSGGSPSDAAGIGLFLDIGSFIALIWMIIANKPPKVLPPPPPV
jgi:hypothetical protein